MATQPDESKPTIVLVHGAWADATGFDAEIRALQREGFRAIGFANPLRDLAADSTYLAEFLADADRPDRARRPLLRRQRHLDRRDRQRPGQGTRLSQRMDVRRGREPAGAPREVRGQPRGALDQARALHQRGRERGRGPLPCPRAFREAFAADVDQAQRTSWPLRSGRTPPPRSPARRRRRRRGRRCRAGICSAPRTRRSRRRSSGSWPSARTRRSWRCRPRTFRSCRSPTPRPSSSFRPSRRPCPRRVAPSSPTRSWARRHRNASCLGTRATAINSMKAAVA